MFGRRPFHSLPNDCSSIGRSIVHDIGVALNSSAHVVTLERTRQGAFALESEGVESSASREVPEILKPCLEWSTVQKAIDTKKAEAESEGGDKVEQGKSEWEQAILAILQQSTAG